MKDLEFNEEKVVFTYQDGEYFIAIKPLCVGLGIAHKHQFEVIKKDVILGPAYRNYGIQVANQTRRFICLPEHLIYGWLMQVNSNDPKLEQFKIQCHAILYEYFKGIVVGRKNLIVQKANLLSEKQKLEVKLVSNDLFIKWQEKERMIEKINSLLRNQDRSAIKESMTLFD